jgi:hypothetical protein
MATGAEVLSMLIPKGGWVIFGDDYDGIQFLECEPITKTQFEAGFSKVDAWKAERQVAREALLTKLGITEQEAQLLLGS